MNDQERLELMLDYALGTADATRMEIARQGLVSGDPAWPAALAEAEATLAAYAAARAPLEPPHQGKSKLMSAVAREQSFGRRVGGHQVPDDFRGIRRFAQGFAILAALLLIGVLVNVFVTRRISQAREEARLEYRNDIIESKSALMAMQLRIQHDENVLQVLHEQNIKIVDISAQPAGPGTPAPTGRILIDQKTATWHVYTESLSPLPVSKTYQLWFITPQQKMISAGTFNVDPQGNGEMTVKVPPTVGDVAVAAITEEPAGGSPQPTKLPPVMSGKL